MMNLDRSNAGLPPTAEAISEGTSFIVVRLDKNLWDVNGTRQRQKAHWKMLRLQRLVGIG